MSVDHISQDSDNQFRFDIYRTIVLGHYLKHWGMPEYRKVVGRDDGSSFEIHTFPSSPKKHVYHIATVGLAEQARPDGSKQGHEYFMTLDERLGGASRDEVFDYVADLCAHSIVNLPRAQPPRVLGPSALAPPEWTTKALLIDEPRGETEEFHRIAIGEIHEVECLWLVPLHEREYRFILEKGIDAFDELEQSAAHSIADVNRQAFC